MVGVATALILVIIILCVSRPWADYYRPSKYSDKQQGEFDLLLQQVILLSVDSLRL